MTGSWRGAVCSLALHGLVAAALLLWGHAPPPEEEPVLVVELLAETPPPVPASEPVPAPAPAPVPAAAPTPAPKPVPHAVRPAAAHALAPSPAPASAPAPVPAQAAAPSPAATAEPLPPPAVVPTAVSAERRESSMGSYLADVRGRVGAHVVYPRQSQRRGEQGNIKVRAVVAASGGLLAVEAEGDGPSPLCDAAIDAVRRTAPFPPLPAELGEQVTLVIPVVFSLL